MLIENHSFSKNVKTQRVSGYLHSWGMREQPLLIAITHKFDVLTSNTAVRQMEMK